MKPHITMSNAKRGIKWYTTTGLWSSEIMFYGVTSHASLFGSQWQWAQIPSETLQNHVETISRRVESVIAEKGPSSPHNPKWYR